MDLIARFAAYATEFEKAYSSREWDTLGDYFTEDAIYRVTGGPPLGGEWKGRDALVGQLHHIVDTFDREFDERIVRAKEAPFCDGDTVHVAYAAQYRLEGAPTLRFEGVERAVYRGELIAELVDEFDEETAERVHQYADEYLGGRSR